MNATDCFALTLKSSWSTLNICIKQSRKDSLKVFRFARKYAPIVWRYFLIVCFAFYWLGMVARDVWEEFVQPNIDEFVESHLEEETKCKTEQLTTLYSRIRGGYLNGIYRKLEALLVRMAFLCQKSVNILKMPWINRWVNRLGL